MFIEEICSWMAQADHDEEQQEHQQVYSNSSLLCQRAFGKDSPTTTATAIPPKEW